MNYPDRFRDKQTVGLIANSLSILILIRFLIVFALEFNELPNTSISGLILVVALMFAGVVPILLSTRFLRQNQTQTKGIVFGKAVALFFSVVVISFVILGRSSITSIADLFTLLLAMAQAFYAPYSYYLLRKTTDPNNPLTKTIASTEEVSKVSPDDLKLPPNAWS